MTEVEGQFKLVIERLYLIAYLNAILLGITQYEFTCITKRTDALQFKLCSHSYRGVLFVVSAAFYHAYDLGYHQVFCIYCKGIIGQGLLIKRIVEIVFAKIGIEPHFHLPPRVNSHHLLVHLEVTDATQQLFEASKSTQLHPQTLPNTHVANIRKAKGNVLDVYLRAETLTAKSRHAFILEILAVYDEGLSVSPPKRFPVELQLLGSAKFERKLLKGLLMGMMCQDFVFSASDFGVVIVGTLVGAFGKVNSWQIGGVELRVSHEVLFSHLNIMIYTKCSHLVMILMLDVAKIIVSLCFSTEIQSPSPSQHFNTPTIPPFGTPAASCCSRQCNSFGTCLLRIVYRGDISKAFCSCHICGSSCGTSSWHSEAYRRVRRHWFSFQRYQMEYIFFLIFSISFSLETILSLQDMEEEPFFLLSSLCIYFYISCMLSCKYQFISCYCSFIWLQDAYCLLIGEGRVAGVVGSWLFYFGEGGGDGCGC